MSSKYWVFQSLCKIYSWRFLSFKLCCLGLVEVVKEDGIVGLVVYEEVEVWKIIKFELRRS